MNLLRERAKKAQKAKQKSEQLRKRKIMREVNAEAKEMAPVIVAQCEDEIRDAVSEGKLRVSVELQYPFGVSREAFDKAMHMAQDLLNEKYRQEKRFQVSGVIDKTYHPSSGSVSYDDGTYYPPTPAYYEPFWRMQIKW